MLLASCTLPWTVQSPVSNPVPVLAPAQAVVSVQSDSPAARYCLAHSGSVSLETNPAIPTMELIYCTTTGSGKVDAWKYMADMENVTPIPMTTVSGEVN
jgi:putative hemolysin